MTVPVLKPENRAHVHLRFAGLQRIQVPRAFDHGAPDVGALPLPLLLFTQVPAEIKIPQSDDRKQQQCRQDARPAVLCHSATGLGAFVGLFCA